MRNSVVFLASALSLVPAVVQAQIILPAPRPVVTGGFANSNNALLPATVVSQSSLAPIPSSNALRRQVAPFNSAFGGYLGGGYFLYYPPTFGLPSFNPTVNVNLSVVTPQPDYTPVFRANPLYGVKEVEPVSLTTARVVVQVPLDAEVWVNGEKTPQKGNRRVYESPTLTNGRPFDFEVKVTWTENDKKQTEEKKFSLTAGESRTMVILSNR